MLNKTVGKLCVKCAVLFFFFLFCFFFALALILEATYAYAIIMHVLPTAHCQNEYVRDCQMPHMTDI